MIQLPSDYNQAQAYTGQSYPQLPVGGHICSILGAQVVKSSKGNDMLVVMFDVKEGGAFDGYYALRYANSKSYNPNASWPGTFRANIANSDGTTNGWFKGLIDSVEKSNAGYNFAQTGANEQTLKGKMVGFNFGEEEYLQQSTNQVRTTVKAMYAVPVSKVQEGIEPPEKRQYKPNNAQPPAQGMTPANGFTYVDDNDLPF